MRIVKANFTIQDKIDGWEVLKRIELAGRTCYKSEGNITGLNSDAAYFVRKLISAGHESVLEHEKVTVRIVCDRGVSHELVRHRLASYSQESTRYCDYNKTADIEFVLPCWLCSSTEHYSYWKSAMRESEVWYKQLRAWGWSPQQARAVLPNSLKTEIVVTANLREWRHIFILRTSPAAHPQMREIMVPMLREFKTLIPVVFDDIEAR